MRAQITTADADVAHGWLRDAYGDHEVTISGRPTDFRFAHSMADFGSFTVGVARHSMVLQGSWEPLDDVLLFSHLLSGRFVLRSPSSEVVGGPGDVLSYDPDARTDVEWHDFRMAQLRIQRSAVERAAAEMLGEDRATPRLAFDLGRPLSEAKGVHWKRLMQYVSGDVARNPGVNGNPLVVRHVQRLIVATLLETFPNSSQAGYRTKTQYAAPDAVRRAIAFMEEHAGEDLDLTTIADAAHVGPRALQRAFRRSMDQTPLGFLRSVRLDRAHDELRAADPAGTTVGAVAARWGFGHPGRFAADYRTRFERSPSDTLRG